MATLLLADHDNASVKDIFVSRKYRITNSSGTSSTGCKSSRAYQQCESLRYHGKIMHLRRVPSI